MFRLSLSQVVHFSHSNLVNEHSFRSTGEGRLARPLVLRWHCVRKNSLFNIVWRGDYMIELDMRQLLILWPEQVLIYQLEEVSSGKLWKTFFMKTDILWGRGFRSTSPFQVLWTVSSETYGDVFYKNNVTTEIKIWRKTFRITLWI